MMDLVKLNKPTKCAYFSILVLSISFVFAQGISNNYFNFSVEASQYSINDVPRIIGIQGDSQNGIQTSPPDVNKDPEDNQGTSGLPDGSNQGETNGSGGQVTDGLTGGTNQTLQTQSQTTNQTGSQTTNQNLDQTTNQNVDQTTNQNVNQTTDQNVNVQTDQNVNTQTKQKLDLLFVEQGAAQISVEDRNRIESEDKILITQHVVLKDPACRTGNVLAGVPNAQDLRILLECQDAIGTVVHTKKLDNGHYVFFLELDDQFKFLLNERNNEDTAGLLVVDIVPQDQTIPGVFLPVDGDRVHVWGAWVTDTLEGWHEIQPAWKVISQ
ncbi:MAG: hypothetical protein ACP5OH_07500 [Nitrososphaerota archaeon]